MKKEEIFELTNKLYKLTLLFPKKEPLRYKIREKADQILANFVYWQSLKDSNPGNLALNWEKRYKELVFIIERDAEILNGLFEVAKWQNWVSYFDILEIQDKYDRIKCYFKNEAESLGPQGTVTERAFRGPSFGENFGEKLEPLKTKIIPSQEKQFSLDTRKEKILKILGEKGKAQVWEVKEIFPEVSKRTLRRDFEKLLKQGIIRRIGERNKTFYQLS